MQTQGFWTRRKPGGGYDYLPVQFNWDDQGNLRSMVNPGGGVQTFESGGLFNNGCDYVIATARADAWIWTGPNQLGVRDASGKITPLHHDVNDIYAKRPDIADRMKLVPKPNLQAYGTSGRDSYIGIGMQSQPGFKYPTQDSPQVPSSGVQAVPREQGPSGGIGYVSPQDQFLQAMRRVGRGIPAGLQSSPGTAAAQATVATQQAGMTACFAPGTTTSIDPATGYEIRRTVKANPEAGPGAFTIEWSGPPEWERLQDQTPAMLGVLRQFMTGIGGPFGGYLNAALDEGLRQEAIVKQIVGSQAWSEYERMKSRIVTESTTHEQMTSLQRANWQAIVKKAGITSADLDASSPNRGNIVAEIAKFPGIGQQVSGLMAAGLAKGDPSKVAKALGPAASQFALAPGAAPTAAKAPTASSSRVTVPAALKALKR